MRELAFLADTCTLEGYLARSPGLHPALRFRYRPATISERLVLDASGSGDEAQNPAQLAAALLARKLVSWQAPDDPSPPPAISPAGVLSLQSELFMKLYRVVLGQAASEIDPLWPAETVNTLLRDQAEAATSGRSVGEIGQERREKNCSRG